MATATPDVGAHTGRLDRTRPRSLFYGLVLGIALTGCGGPDRTTDQETSDRSGSAASADSTDDNQAEPQPEQAGGAPSIAASSEPPRQKASDAVTGQADTEKPAEPKRDQPDTAETQSPPQTEQEEDAEEQKTEEELPELVSFEPLATTEPVSMMTMTEDGRHLVMAHRAAGRVSIWDIRAGEAVKTLNVPAPRALLCRSGRLFVANRDKGTISIFDREQGWQLTDELLLARSGIVYMSAPQGPYFNNELLVTCHGKGSQASYRDSSIVHLDVKQDESKQVAGSPLATVSYDGRLVYTQASFNLSPSGQIRAYPYQAFVRGSPDAVFAGGTQQTPFVYQVHDGSYWLTDRVVFGGSPVQVLKKDLGKLIVPDLAQRVIYSLTRDRLKAYELNAAFTEIDMRRAEFPPRQQKKFDGIYNRLYRRRGYRLDHPVGYTHGKALHLFAMDIKANTVLHAKTRAFRTPENAETSTSPDEGATAAESPPRTTDPSGHARPREKNLGIPARIVEGQELAHELPGGEQPTYELMKEPRGMSLTAGRRLRWTPGDDDVGMHELKVKVTSAGSVSIVRPSIEVIDDALAARVGGDLSKLEEFERLGLEPDHFALVPGRNYARLLLLQGRVLRVLGPDGLTVKDRQRFSRRFRFVAEREKHYVLVAKDPPLLEVVSKRTLETVRSIPLDRAGVRILDVTDLAIHPRRDVSYVAVKYDVRIPRYRVLMIDESEEAVAAPDILLGTWVAVGPRGRSLYTGWKDIYRRGSRFHLNPGLRLIEIPEYGNIDMLISYRLQGAKPVPYQVVSEAGGNGSGIRLSPDGERITYLSHVGYPLHSQNLASFRATDFEKPAVRYRTKGRGSTKKLAFHPTLDLVAVPGSGSAVFFNRETGEIEDHRLLLTAKGLGGTKVLDLVFSPDGRNLIFVCEGGPTGRYLRKVALKLTSAERKRVAAGIDQPEPRPETKRTTRTVSREQIQALAKTEGSRPRPERSAAGRWTRWWWSKATTASAQGSPSADGDIF